MVREYGLKLWSTNAHYVAPARQICDAGGCSFIELFVQPGTFENSAGLWDGFKVPFIVHAPHYAQGLNFSDRSFEERNRVLANDARRWADRLKARYIIFHPGVAGPAEEAARQLSALKEPRAVVENKPYHTVMNDGRICTGNSVDEIRTVLRGAGCGFCLDIGHAFCGAAGNGRDGYEYISEFIMLEPVIYHLSDGYPGTMTDVHLHIGSGGYDMERIMNMLPKNAVITVETEKSHPDSLADFDKDVMRLKQIETSQTEKLI